MEFNSKDNYIEDEGEMNQNVNKYLGQNINNKYINKF